MTYLNLILLFLQEGVFPSNFVSATSTVAIREQVATPSVVAVQENAPELPPKPMKELARVLFPYISSQPDELELKEGDIVTVLSKECEDKGWWKGKLNNKVGNRFPFLIFRHIDYYFTFL